MRGSMDVVDAERLQRSGVAMAWVGRRNVLKREMDYHIRFTLQFCPSSPILETVPYDRVYRP